MSNVKFLATLSNCDMMDEMPTTKSYAVGAVTTAEPF
jgi:hypothetical protein